MFNQPPHTLLYSLSLPRSIFDLNIQLLKVMRGKEQSHPDFKQAQTTIQFLLGPIKIKDGLFMGDQLAARDIEFIVTNKVTHVINTVAKAVPNLYERFGVQYLSVHWTEKEENIFDKKNNALNAIFTFVEEAVEQGESCLIHSLHGKSRACAVLAAYLMRKYGWSLNKTLQLINSKKEGLDIRSNYLAQMQELQSRLSQTTKLSYSWSESKGEEDQLLANTFSNSKKAGKPDSNFTKRQNIRKVTWDEKQPQKFAPGSTNNMAITMNRIGKPKETPKVRSILKGFPNQQQSKQRIESKGESMGAVGVVTINNFMQSEKKQEGPQMYNNRPYSSDNKERQKKPNPYDLKPNKLFSYDNPIATNIKTAYDSKLVTKLGGVTAGSISKGAKKPEEVKKGVGERPQSANIVGQRRKAKNVYPYPGAQELMVNTVSKKRYPSTNAREEVIRLK